jgi:hypothetical protein
VCVGVCVCWCVCVCVCVCVYAWQEQLKRAEELFADMDVRRQQLKLSVGMLEERLLDFQVLCSSWNM